MTHYFIPMEPVLRDDIVSDPRFIHQIKWDGIRGLAHIEDHIKILSKKGIDITLQYPELQCLAKHLKGKNAVLDGEIVSLNEEGKPDFSRIHLRQMQRSELRIKSILKDYPINYIIFDILFLDNRDLRNKPFHERASILRESVSDCGIISLSEDFDDGESLFEAMKKNNMEGIVSKNIDSSYLEGKHHNQWFKTKIRKQMLTVVGGLQFKNEMPISLLLGIYTDQGLFYIGNASLGLKQKDLYILRDSINALKSETTPFINLSSGKEIVWLKPTLTCIASFLERSGNGTLRHPQIAGFSKDPAEKANGKEMIK